MKRRRKEVHRAALDDDGEDDYDVGGGEDPGTASIGGTDRASAIERPPRVSLAYFRGDGESSADGGKCRDSAEWVVGLEWRDARSAGSTDGAGWGRDDAACLYEYDPDTRVGARA